MTKTKSTTTEKAKWQLNLHQAQNLRKQGIDLLFERITLLVACFYDEDFVLWCNEQDDTPEEYLDREVSDFCGSFLTAKAVYEANTDVEAWQRHGFAYLAHELAESQKKPSNPGTSYKAKYEQMCRECERLHAEIETLKESLAIVSGRGVESGAARKLTTAGSETKAEKA